MYIAVNSKIHLICRNSHIFISQKIGDHAMNPKELHTLGIDIGSTTVKIAILDE